MFRGSRPFEHPRVFRTILHRRGIKQQRNRLVANRVIGRAAKQPEGKSEIQNPQDRRVGRIRGRQSELHHGGLGGTIDEGQRRTEAGGVQRRYDFG